MNDNSDFVDVDVQVIGMTDGAFLMRDDENSVAKWVPRSLIENDVQIATKWYDHRQHRTDAHQPLTITASIAEWKATELRWI